MKQKQETIKEIKALNSYLETLDEKQLKRFTNIINLGNKYNGGKNENKNTLI